MTSDSNTQLSDLSVACLACACTTSENHAARMLMMYAGSESVTGVLAAVYMAINQGETYIIELTRSAILHERAFCRAEGREEGRNCRGEALKHAS